MSRQRAGLYLRISQDTLGDGAGVDRQERDAQVLAKARGLRITDTYTDNDHSAWSGKARPEWDRMLADLAAGRLDAVLAWSNDRLYRRTRDQLTLMESAVEVGGVIITCKDGDVDPSTAEGRMRMTILASIAEFESGRKSERVRAKLADKAAKGEPHGGRRPFGWLADRVTLDPTEAPIVRELARRVLAGESLRSIAQGLNTRGVPTVLGRTWGIATVRSMLLNPRLAGHRTHRGAIVGRGSWEPILTEETWQRVRALLTDPARRTTRPGARRYALTGLVHCGRCGCAMVAQPRANGQRRYVCTRDPGRRGGKACGSVTVMAQPVEDGVDAAMLLLAEEQADLAARITEGLEEPADSAQIEAQLAQLAGQAADLELTPAEWQALRSGMARKLEEAQALEAEAHRQRVSAVRVEDLAQRWTGMTADEKRAAMDTLIERVTILPAAARAARRFDPERVQVEWRIA